MKQCLHLRKHSFIEINQLQKLCTGSKYAHLTIYSKTLEMNKSSPSPPPHTNQQLINMFTRKANSANLFIKKREIKVKFKGL